MEHYKNAGDSLTPEDLANPFARTRHARYFEAQVVYHIISRTRGNLFLFRPDIEGVQRKIVAGVLREAQDQYGNIANYATSLMSNHLHTLLAAKFGDPRTISDYMRFIKGELTRRWNKEIGWSGSAWDGFIAAAVVSPEAQIRALKYTMSQTVKEGLVATPQEWPGFHCAESLVSGDPVKGFWFDGIGYGKKFHAEKQKNNPSPVLRDTYKLPREFTFDKLPALSHLNDAAYRETMADFVDEIVAEGIEARDGKEPLGAEAVCAVNRLTPAPVPVPPWFKERKRMVVWDDPTVPEVKEYLGRYWRYQTDFREAADLWKHTQPRVAFPPLSFVPGLRPRPIAHMEQSSA